MSWPSTVKPYAAAPVEGLSSWSRITLTILERPPHRLDHGRHSRLEIAFDHIEDVMRLDPEIDDYNRRIVAEIKTSGTTLIRRYGVGSINAALILGEVGDVSRFPNRHHFASYTGTSPISASSPRSAPTTSSASRYGQTSTF